VALVLAVCFFAWFTFFLPDPLFSVSYSRVLKSREGKLLAAAVSEDAQWRFPAGHYVSPKFATCLITFEDKRFLQHPGVDPIALFRAIYSNVKEGKIISGGSTITMQVARMARGKKSRNVWQKFMECLWALRIELRYSKDEILALYAAHAPFGGNVVGVEAACWRYYGSTSDALSWAEAATLAVLPNAPSLMHPGKNTEALFQKRNQLLQKLKYEKIIDEEEYALSILEKIPEVLQRLPRHARHLLQNDFVLTTDSSTIRYDWQLRLEERVQQHHEYLRANDIQNLAAIILDVKTGEIVAYAGNILPDNRAVDAEVDAARANRSTGSILKPFLYAIAIDEGLISPTSLLTDVPTYINGFAPRNFNREFDGAVPAHQALIRSLNVPAVYLLQQYRYEKFHTLLKKLGIHSLTQSPDHYGLSMILGGAEGNLIEITGAYAAMARVLNQYFERPGERKYAQSDWRNPSYQKNLQQDKDEINLSSTSPLSASSIYHTLNELTEVYRPGEETGWRNFYHTKKIAWKTGTSFGFRDGWAVGVTPQYAVGVWVGNADGEGRPNLTGTESAAPLLFSIFDFLPTGDWFQEPKLEQITVPICSVSGYKASTHCPKTDTILLPRASKNLKLCNFHQHVNLDRSLQFTVNSSCYNIFQMVDSAWFVLPPVQAYYYQRKHSHYHPLPPIHPNCLQNENVSVMDLVYPKNGSKIFIPRGLDGKFSELIIELAHVKPDAIVYWHMDGTFLGKTQGKHQFAILPETGKHFLSLVDDKGNVSESRFEVTLKDK
jgi:penicillin-binding protein 1C